VLAPIREGLDSQLQAEIDGIRRVAEHVMADLAAGQDHAASRRQTPSPATGPSSTAAARISTASWPSWSRGDRRPTRSTVDCMDRSEAL
jgi:hypothetical protein